MHESEIMYATDVRNQLLTLREEREIALAHGFGADQSFMADLERDIAACRDAWVGAAVTEIALLRASLSGPQNG